MKRALMLFTAGFLAAGAAKEPGHGIRELKLGKHGRITNVPSVSSLREKTGLAHPRALVDVPEPVGIEVIEARDYLIPP